MRRERKWLNEKSNYIGRCRFSPYFDQINRYTTALAGHNKVATLFWDVYLEPFGEGLHNINPLLKFSEFD